MLVSLCVAAFTMEQLSSANTLFALELFHSLSENSTGNIFISPFSISSALAMVFLGARGNTAAQLSKVSRRKTGPSHSPLPANSGASELFFCVF